MCNVTQWSSVLSFSLLGLSLFAWHCASRYRAASQRSHLPNRHFHTLQKCKADQVSVPPHLLLLRSAAQHLKVKAAGGNTSAWQRVNKPAKLVGVLVNYSRNTHALCVKVLWVLFVPRSFHAVPQGLQVIWEMKSSSLYCMLHLQLNSWIYLTNFDLKSKGSLNWQDLLKIVFSTNYISEY